MHRDRRSSASTSTGTGWVPRRATKGGVSNFDVRPPNGVDLPPIGVTATVHGQPNAHLSFMTHPPGGAPEEVPAEHDPTAALTRIDTSQHTRHARRIYAGGAPPRATEAEIMAFFNDIVSRLLAPQRTNGPPCIKVYLNVEKCYAFVEFLSVELASACMALDGIRFEHPTGTTVLRIRRPNDYRPELLPPQGALPHLNQQLLEALGATAMSVGKLFVGGLPYNLVDEQVMELLGAFGPLKAFHQVRELGSNMSKGYAFAEYVNPEHGEAAIRGLNGMPLGDKTMTVRPAVTSSNTSSSSTAHTPSAVPPLVMANSIASLPPTRVLKLCNMLTADDLDDDAEYLDILEDVRLECADYGAVRSLLIPRAKEGYAPSAEGFIFVEFNDTVGARNAALALHNRKFADKTVVVQYFDENSFANKVLY